ncbi:MAG: alginate export family protein [Planctomycetes bacterium]|nr:alginate export family protein [Planctomycetota bacterium]
MHYGDQRVIGHLEWFDQGRSYDGIRAHYAPEKWWLDLFAVRVRETTPPVMDDDQWFAGLYAGCDWAEAYALLFADDMAMAGETTTDDTRFLTLGLRVHRKRGNWDYSAEFTFQTGEVKGDDLSAFGFAAVGGYTFADADWTPRVGIEVDFATGDEDPTDGDQGTLQTLFPTNHLHYGYADLLGWANLLDLSLHLSAKPSETVTITLDFHHFRRVEERGGWFNAGGAAYPGPARSGATSTLATRWTSR